MIKISAHVTDHPFTKRWEVRAAKKKHKKIIYKYIDLHMPVTNKRVGGVTLAKVQPLFKELSLPPHSFP